MYKDPPNRVPLISGNSSCQGPGSLPRPPASH